MKAESRAMLSRIQRRGAKELLLVDTGFLLGVKKIFWSWVMVLIIQLTCML
jgi:hypothetical protein